MLAKKHRLKNNDEIKNVFAKGKSTMCGFLFLKQLPNNSKSSRFAFSIGLSYSKSAPKRNALKRKLRSLTAKNISQINPGHDCVFFLKSDSKKVDLQSLEENFLGVLEKSKILKNSI